jgi:hypothetical protein
MGGAEINSKKSTILSHLLLPTQGRTGRGSAPKSLNIYLEHPCEREVQRFGLADWVQLLPASFRYKFTQLHGHI